MAKKAGVHVQALYLNECGCYPTVLPDILDCIVRELRHDPETVERHYKVYVERKRKAFGETHGFKFLTVDDLGEPGGTHPVIAFREQLELSRMGFAKQACIQPTLLYNVEYCRSKRIPNQVVDAMLKAGLAPVVVMELCSRYEEWHDG